MFIFLFFIYGVVVFNIYRFFPVVSILLTSILLLILWYVVFIKKISYTYSNRKVLFLGIGFIIIGFFYTSIFHNQDLNLDTLSGKSFIIECKTTSGLSKPVSSGRFFSQTVKVLKAVQVDNMDLPIQEMIIMSNYFLKYDRVYIVKVHISSSSYYTNPGVKSKTIIGYATEIIDIGSANRGLFENIRSDLNDVIKNIFSNDVASFLISITTGDRNLITEKLQNAFAVTGLIHILSISGSHFGMMFFMLFNIFKFLYVRLPNKVLTKTTIYLTPSQFASAICMPFMLGYLLISDMSFPAIRSFIMIVLFLFGLFSERKGVLLNNILFAVFIILIIDPDSLVDLSFQLSFIAVLSIYIVEALRRKKEFQRQVDLPVPQSIFLKSIRLLFHYLWISFLISSAASLSTSPLVAYQFHNFSLISSLSNLILLPLIGLIILPLTLVSSFIFIVFGVFPLKDYIEPITFFAISLIKDLATIDFAKIRIGAFPPVLLITFYIGMGLFIISTFLKSKKRIIYSIAISLCLAVMPLLIYTLKDFLPEDKYLKVTFLDVGQADAAVVELPDNKTFVIDTGKSGRQVKNFLVYKGKDKIDVIILSHNQMDHSGGVLYLAKEFNIGEIWDNKQIIYPDDLLGQIYHRGLEREDVITGKGYIITVLHPYPNFHIKKGDIKNESSLVLKIKKGTISFLFTGDISQEAQKSLIALGQHLKSSVLKIPHHGGKYSLNKTFLEIVSPQISVISVGKNNQYNHPYKMILDLLESKTVFRTDEQGAIGIDETKDGGLKIKLWRHYQLEKAETLDKEIMNIKRLFMVW